MRVKITLACTICKSKNYISSKNRSSHPGKVETMKFCPKERMVTLHREI
ncbi:50S ribosomal protein L33 [Lactococcus ileimucosae]|uniref:Large ribosomal subunit protein bL33 n=1 Tax=Lactococcus ileimucosae TaxID=2941329 RepID=A0ABV4D1N2_9LACT|nr:50S ribosomal protein L33 [Lactococcus ileimucosae]